MKKIALIFIGGIILVGCSNKKKKEKQKQKSISTTVTKIPKGKELLEKKCFLCHSPSASEDVIVAPPMIAVKAHYIKSNTSKEDFIKEFVDFVKKPNKEKAKLHKAVKRFNLMPYQNYSEEDLKQIALYLFDYQIEEPHWFKEHWSKHNKVAYINSGKKIVKDNRPKTKVEIGLSYALGTKKVLGKNLMGTIQKKGTLEALKFCNHNAYKLTDSMSVKFKATIKRVSDKPRNPKNTANKEELAIIDTYKKTLSKKEKLKPQTKEVNGKTHFYAPIVTNTMCLQCHGKPNKQIKPTTLEKLASLYPTDKAQGYKENQLRGIWSITFEK